MLIFIFTLSEANAQPYFKVYPTEGDVNTDIFLQIRGLPGTGFYEYYYLYIFWDDILLGTFPDNSGTYDHYFDTHFSPPNKGNYSALGNHTVYFEVWNNGRTAMLLNDSFVFTITKYLPCPEYLTLNTTYYQLLTDYNALNDSYQNLMLQYNSLNANYNTLLNQFDNLTGYYNFLQSIHSILTSNYAQLQGNYTQLVTSYSNLQTNHSNLSTDLTNYRNLTYVFIITTAVLLATTIYFARRKQK